MKRKAVLLDRDGVVNIDHGYIGAVDRFAFIPEIFPFLRQARDKGYRLAVVTNQSGVARGLYSQTDYEAVNQAMIDGLKREGIELDLVLACFYHPEGENEALRRTSFWRKPDPGMLLEAAMRLDIDLPRSIMIGDKDRDVQAGLAAGVGTCLLLSDQASVHPQAYTIKCLDEAAAFLA